jgi:hypothetical protein
MGNRQTTPIRCHPERRTLGAPQSGVSGAKDLLLTLFYDKQDFKLARAVHDVAYRVIA